MPREAGALLPLPHFSYHILIALADGPRHGWSIIQRIVEAGAGRRPSSGSLYLAILRLEKQGLVEETAEPAQVERSDERRRYYRLTPFGESVLEAETRRLARLIEIAEGRRALDRPLRPAADPGA